MTKIQKLRGVKTRFGVLGIDGLFTFSLSNLILLLTAGISLIWPLRQVIKTAQKTSTTAPASLMLVVLGKSLQQGEIDTEYAERLERSFKLYQVGHRPILILGGVSNNRYASEAEKGREYLLRKNVNTDDILIEDASLHTLENLHNVRAIIQRKSLETVFVLITSRYHLKRSEVIANGLGMQPVLCAAEEKFNFTWHKVPRLLLEAFYIHWYHTGSIWSRLTHNKKSLSRIS
ncbi:MAG TPA: YdcF family protein [Chromatiales bacterium]|nr:YdcF family protein [Thiotrichales bacterium]HIP68107.1 YdcF family protein [Chromatiales bacterium]